MRVFICLILLYCINSCNHPVRNGASEDVKDNNRFYFPGLKLVEIKSSEAGYLRIVGFVEGYSIVPLEMNDSALIANPDRVVIRGQYIIIKERDRLHIYSQTGAHISTINRKGRGPGEYIQINGFDFCPEEDIVYVADHSRLLLYNISGRFIRCINVPWRVFEFAVLKDRFVFSPITMSGGTENDYNIVLTDKALNILAVRDKLPIWEGPFFSWSGTTLRVNMLSAGISYFSYFGDTVFYISPDSIYPGIHLRWDSNYHITGEFPGGNREIYSGVVFRETDNIFTLSYNFGNESYLMIQSKFNPEISFHGRIEGFRFDNITESGPFLYVENGKLESLVSFLDENDLMFEDRKLLNEIIRHENSYNGAMVFYSWGKRLMNQPADYLPIEELKESLR